MDSEILKEFLVKLGFRVDETGNKKLDDQLKRTTKNVQFIGEAIAGVVTAATGMTLLFAASMEKMYYASRRTGATVANLQAIEYAGRQIGLSAGASTQAVESLAQNLRSNPGLVGLLHGEFGIKTQGRDTTQILLDLVGKLRQMPYFQAKQFGEMFGLNPQTLLMMEQGYGKLRGLEQQRLRMNQQAGINPNEQARQAHQIMVEFRRLMAQWNVLKSQLASDFMPVAHQMLQWGNDLLTLLIKLDKATHGWSNRIGFVVTALASWKAAMSALSRFGAKIAVGSGAEAAAGAAGGAAEAGAAGAAGAGLGGALLRGMGGVGTALSRISASLGLAVADLAAINQAYQAITTGHSQIADWLNNQIGSMLGVKGWSLGGQIFDWLHPQQNNFRGGLTPLTHAGPTLGLHGASMGPGMTFQQTNHYEVHGTDPQSTADAVGTQQRHSNSELVRNLRGAMR